MMRTANVTKKIWDTTKSMNCEFGPNAPSTVPLAPHYTIARDFQQPTIYNSLYHSQTLPNSLPAPYSALQKVVGTE